MASNPGALLERYGTKIVLDSLEKVVGQSAAFLADDDAFRRMVVDPAWEMLPVQLRLLGRELLGWDEMFQQLRREAFDTQGARIGLRTDAATQLLSFISKLNFAPGPPTLAPEVGSSRKLFDQSAKPAVTALPTTPGHRAPLPVVSPAPNTASNPAIFVETRAMAPLAEIALGIDLGTTYSVVAHVDHQGRPCSIPNSVGEILTPSVVLFDVTGPVVGKEAVMASTMEPEKVADVVKRDMGAKYYRKKIKGEDVPPEVIASFILKSLRSDAERKLGKATKAVITVPAYFDEPRRRATMDAGRLAGLEVLDILNEPTAAAIAYGYQTGFLDRSGRTSSVKPLRMLAFDLGGGTFDVTIVEIQSNYFKAIATDGDVSLGGKDWDEQIVKIAAERFKKQHRMDPREDPSTLQDLWNKAEIAKKALTERTQTSLYIDHHGSRMKIDINRTEFEQATAFLLTRTETTTQIVLRQAGLQWSDIDKVLLVGGSTRMPMIPRMLTELTGQTPDRSVSPDEAVAHGAALYAELQLYKGGIPAPPQVPQFKVTNVNAHSLGILGTDLKTGKRRNQVLIQKNTPLPHSTTGVFKTSKANQKSVRVTVVEGESTRPEACSQIGTFVIDNLPPNLPAGWPVEVTYRYQENGRLDVTCKLKGQTTGVSTVFHRDNSLQESDLKLWLQYVSSASVHRE